VLCLQTYRYWWRFRSRGRCGVGEEFGDDAGGVGDGGLLDVGSVDVLDVECGSSGHRDTPARLAPLAASSSLNWFVGGLPVGSACTSL
jgi:hypothetical protein